MSDAVEVATEAGNAARPLDGHPGVTVTADGQPIIRTAQARLYVRARTAQSMSGLARVELPILIELAASEARLKSLSSMVDMMALMFVDHVEKLRAESAKPAEPPPPSPAPPSGYVKPGPTDPRRVVW